jgi:hypothetical protein
MKEDVVVESRTETRVPLVAGAAIALLFGVLFFVPFFVVVNPMPQVITCIDNIDETPPGLNDPEGHGPDYKPAVTVQVETERKPGRFAKREFLGCTFYWYNHAPFR